MFTKYVSVKWILSIIYKEYNSVVIRTLNKTYGQKTGHFIKEDTQMANEDMKRCPALLGKLQYDTTM